jgi:hypothetical protein
MEVSDQIHVPAAYLPGKARGTHWIGSWVDPRAGLYMVSKRKILSPCRDLNPYHPIIQLVIISYTD